MIIRNIKDEDKAALGELIAKDEHHRETTTPEFFYESGTRCVVYESEDLDHKMFVRFSNCLRLDIQFDNEDHLFNAKTILRKLPGLISWAKSKGFKEIVFSSKSMELIAFLNNKFGFAEMPDFRLLI